MGRLSNFPWPMERMRNLNSLLLAGVLSGSTPRPPTQAKQACDWCAKDGMCQEAKCQAWGRAGDETRSPYQGSMHTRGSELLHCCRCNCMLLGVPLPSFSSSNDTHSNNEWPNVDYQPCCRYELSQDTFPQEIKTPLTFFDNF